MSRRSRRSEKIWSDLRTIDQKLFERLRVSCCSTNFIRAAYSRSSALFSYFISFDDTERHKADRMIQEKALFSPGWQDGLKSFYSLTTSNLIKEKSWSYDDDKTFNLDVVRDVTNVSARPLLPSRATSLIVQFFGSSSQASTGSLTSSACPSKTPRQALMVSSPLKNSISS